MQLTRHQPNQAYPIDPKQAAEKQKNEGKNTKEKPNKISPAAVGNPLGEMQYERRRIRKIFSYCRYR